MLARAAVRDARWPPELARRAPLVGVLRVWIAVFEHGEGVTAYDHEALGRQLSQLLDKRHFFSGDHARVGEAHKHQQGHADGQHRVAQSPGAANMAQVHRPLPVAVPPPCVIVENLEEDVVNGHQNCDGSGADDLRDGADLRVDVSGVFLTNNFHNLGVARHEGDGAGREVVPVGRLSQAVRPGVLQGARDLHLVVDRCEVQRREAILVLVVDIGLVADHLLHLRRVAADDGLLEGIG
mmetsp:Transcript_16130/g.48626  ORF Transcript_16130/g.48626 Transcript_16130/m.48626 type:complete len:238 (-) Transcript_16130:202-915(-)